ncbi:MAG: hypothetical protein WBK88_04530 [Methanothrix sp.]
MARFWYEEYEGWCWSNGAITQKGLISARSAIEDYRIANEAWDLSVEELAQEAGIEEEI